MLPGRWPTRFASSQAYSVKADRVIQTVELGVYPLSTIGFYAWIRTRYLSNEDPAAVRGRF